MKPEELEQLPREKLLVLLRDALKNMIRIDGYWFLGLEKQLGTEKAVEVDEEVWQRFGSVEAFQIKRNFSLSQEVIPALIQALGLAPSWTFLANYELQQLSPNLALLKVAHCQSQAERLRAGLGLFSCRDMEEGYLSSFAQVIDPRLKVHCDFCPLEERPPGLWCQWRFELEG